VTFDVREDVPRQMLGDPLRFRQILSNLLSNAIKFTQRGSVDLRVNARPHEDPRNRKPLLLGITVTDTGSGIPREKLQAIFEKFTQADGSISRQYGGTGLGLAITRRLVELQEGTILVESEVGRGSRFTVEIPADSAATEMRESAIPVLHPAEGAWGSSTQLRRILLVEDNAINQKVVTALLRKRGYQVDVAGHGQRALEMLEEKTYGLVLMDVQMPVLDGLETTRRIRGDRRFDNLPIVAMTAHAMNGDRDRCLQAGMNGYLAKPVDHRHLLAVADQYLALGPEPPPPPASITGVNADLVSRLMDTDPTLVGQMVQLFLQLAPERMERLKSSATRGDLDLLRSDARKLRAAAHSIAATAIAASAADLERAGDKGDWATIAQSIISMESELRRLQSSATFPVTVH
jgi:CheY-like chemotaxis protein/HPt (histidine-containing phosphotransfer) domain-containing protein